MANKRRVPRKDSLVVLWTNNCMLQTQNGVKGVHALEMDNDEEKVRDYIINNLDGKDYCVIRGKVLKGWLDPYPFN